MAKLSHTILLISILLIGNSIFAQPRYTPSTAPYYGTPEYPYWGKYIEANWSDLRPTQWIDKDTIAIGWDWSLPSNTELPQKSMFTLARNSGIDDKNLKTLKIPHFPCKPVVTHWVNWKYLEPVEGQFDFSKLKENIQLANSNGYKSIVRIHSSATIFAPDWMKNFGIATKQGKKVVNYDVADLRFHIRYLKLVEEFGKSGIPQMEEVVGLFLGYASSSYGDEGIGPYAERFSDANDTVKHVIERIDAWAKACSGVEYKVVMGGMSDYGFSKGFGIRRGFVEMYLYHIPNAHIGQQLDKQGYLYVDEMNPIIKNNLFQGEENEEYSPRWASAEADFRFGTSTESFPYRMFTSNLRLLQMRCNEVLYYSKAVFPEMLPWVAQELGRTIDEAPDVWSFLRESYLKSGDIKEVKNFERWLFQRDAPGYETSPAVKINIANPNKMWMIDPLKPYDYIAREGKKIGFNIDKNWKGTNDSLAFKISLFDHNPGTIILKYSNGNQIVSLSKPLLGDSLLKTYTFFVSDFKNETKIGGSFDFILEAGAETKNIVVSFVRVVQVGTNKSKAK